MVVKSILAAGGLIAATTAPLAAPVAAGQTVTLRVSALETSITRHGVAFGLAENCTTARCSSFELVVYEGGEIAIRLHA